MENVATLIPTYPEITEVNAPIKNANVTQAYPSFDSTKKKITKAKINTKSVMKRYSAAKNADDPLSMYDAISNNKALC